MALSIQKRSGRKLDLAPDGTTASAPPRHRIDNALAKAVARAFRSRKQLETRKYASVAEIATAEKINDSYVGRILRVTLLAPELVSE